MSSTVDTISANIDTQFQCIIDLIEIYDEYQLEPADTLKLEELQIDIKKTQNLYLTSVVDILKNYYQACSIIDEVSIKKYHNMFVKEFHGSNVVGKLKTAYNALSKFRKIYEIANAKINELFRIFETSFIDESFENDCADICPQCKTLFNIEEKTAEFTCKLCGHVEKMYGVVFEVEQFFYQEGSRTKHGKYDPIKHAKFWLDRIQAKENTEIPDVVINTIKRCLRRDQVYIDNIDCETIRKYLKQSKLTSWNNHVVLIRKMITNVEPQQLTDHEISMIYLYFSNVINIFNKNKGDDKSNCPYHPFFIYKIIEQILISAENKERRKSILSCIHLQSRDTLIENDKVWFSICDELLDFTKIATDGDIYR